MNFNMAASSSPFSSSDDEDDEIIQHLIECNNFFVQWITNRSVEESSEDEESYSESEKQESITKPNNKRIPLVKQLRGQEKQSESNEDDNEGDKDEDDDEGSPSVPSFTIKLNTLANRTVKDTNPASKRSVEALKGDVKESRTGKKAKASVENKKDDNFTTGMPRVWSLENVIAMLEGVIDYKNQTGSDPFANMHGFSEFVKENLFSDVSNTQIYEKLRKLKTNFFRQQRRGEDGADLFFSKPFEHKSFELSKNIWGYGNRNIEVEQKPEGKNSTGMVKGSLLNSKAKMRDGKEKGKNDEKYGILEFELAKDVKTKTANNDTIDFSSEYPNLCKAFGTEMGFLNDHLHLIGDTEAKELEEKWTKLRMEEMAVVIKRCNLMAGQIKMVIDAVRKI